MRYDLCVADEPDTSARTLARRRWDQPANVERRVAAVARRIEQVKATLPEGQERDKLNRALDALNPEQR